MPPSLVLVCALCLLLFYYDTDHCLVLCIGFCEPNCNNKNFSIFELESWGSFTYSRNFINVSEHVQDIWWQLYAWVRNSLLKRLQIFSILVQYSAYPLIADHNFASITLQPEVAHNFYRVYMCIAYFRWLLYLCIHQFLNYNANIFFFFLCIFRLLQLQCSAIALSI